LWNNLFVLLCATILASCGLVDFRPIGIGIEPSPNSILSESYSPVIIMFDTGMVKNEAESILQVSSDLGAVRGDKFWRGDHLYFVPVSGWTAGIRYTLSLMGTVRSLDGRELRLGHFASFYAINKNTPPLLEWHSPSSGASIGTNNVVFEFHFSRSMDRLSVESALTLDGVGNKIFEWSADDRQLRVIPERDLSPWIMYRWNLRDSARSFDGVPLPKTYSGHFTTCMDQTLPHVTSIFPVLFSDGSWHSTGVCIETGLRQGQGIAVKFNKPMGENVLRSLRFEPYLTGRTEFLSEESIVYIFTRDPEPDTTYTLIVSGDTRDKEGLKIGSDFRLNFTPDIPFLNVLSFTANGTVFDIVSAVNNVLPVSVDPATGELNFYIQFSLLFGLEERLQTPQRITLTPFFPRTLAPVALQYVNWTSRDRLFMRWEGLIATTGGEEPFYYRLTIPGGRGGISSDTGIYMKHDITLYLEVVR